MIFGHYCFSEFCFSLNNKLQKSVLRNSIHVLWNYLPDSMKFVINKEDHDHRWSGNQYPLGLPPFLGSDAAYISLLLPTTMAWTSAPVGLNSTSWPTFLSDCNMFMGNPLSAKRMLGRSWWWSRGAGTASSKCIPKSTTSRNTCAIHENNFYG